MISSIVSRLVILTFGTLYPAYASYKAVRTKNVKEYVKWMMYWIVFALFTCAETVTDVFFSFWFPFYYEIKVILVLWLLSPATKGSSILYRKFVHPMLTKREQEIDDYIARAKEQGYHTVLSLGTKGVNYATNVIMQTAIKGGGGIVNQLRRSYSLGDISSDIDVIDIGRIISHPDDQMEDTDGSPMDPRILRQRGYKSRSSSGGKVEMYFSEVDVDVRNRGSRAAREPSIPLSSQIRSSEDVSSGYSSADPLYGSQPKTDESQEPLLRTSSVGSTRVTRTKTTRASVATKRPQTEEGSVSSDESEESDSLNQEEHFYDVSTSLPLEPVSIPFPVFPSLPPATLHAVSLQYSESLSQPVPTPGANLLVSSMQDKQETNTQHKMNEITPQLAAIDSNSFKVPEYDQADVILARMPFVILPSASGKQDKENDKDSIKSDEMGKDQVKVADIVDTEVLDVSLQNNNDGTQESSKVPLESAVAMVVEETLMDSASNTECLAAVEIILSSEVYTEPSVALNATADVPNDQVPIEQQQSAEVLIEENTKDFGKIDRAGKYRKRPAPSPPRKADVETDLSVTNEASSISETSSQGSPSPRREMPTPKLDEDLLVKAVDCDVVNKGRVSQASLDTNLKMNKDLQLGSKSPKQSEKKQRSKQDSSISRLLSSFPFWHHNGPHGLVATSLTSLNNLEDLRAMSSGSASSLVSAPTFADSLQAPPLPPRRKSQESSEGDNISAGKGSNQENGKQFRFREMSHSPPRRQKLE